MAKRLDCAGFVRDLRMSRQLQLLEGSSVVHNGKALRNPVAVVLRLENSGSEQLDVMDLGGPHAVGIADGEWAAAGLIGADTPVQIGATEIRLPAVPRAPGDKLIYLLVADLRAAAPAVHLAGWPLPLSRPRPDNDMLGASLVDLTPETDEFECALSVGLKPLLFGADESFMAGFECRRGRQKSVGRTLMSIQLYDEADVTRSPMTISWRGGTVAQHAASRPDYGSRHGHDQDILVDATRALVTGKRSVTIGTRALPGYPPLEADVLIKGDVTDLQLTGGDALHLDAVLQHFSLTAYSDRHLALQPRQVVFSSNPARRLWQSLTQRRRATTPPAPNR